MNSHVHTRPCPRHCCSGLPLMAAILPRLAIGVTDNRYAGWLLGVEALAAVTLADIFLRPLHLGWLCLLAVMPMVAVYHSGADEPRSGLRDTHGAVVELWIWPAALPLMGLTPHQILRCVMGRRRPWSRSAPDYLRVGGLGVFCLRFFVMVLKAIWPPRSVRRVRLGISCWRRYAMGWSTTALISVTGAPRAGCDGGGHRSLSTQVVSLVGVAWCCMCGSCCRQHDLFRRILALNLDMLAQVFRPGGRSGYLAERGRPVRASAVMMGWLGTVRWPRTGLRTTGLDHLHGASGPQAMRLPVRAGNGLRAHGAPHLGAWRMGGDGDVVWCFRR